MKEDFGKETHVRRLVEASLAVKRADLVNVGLFEVEADAVQVLGQDLLAAGLGNDGQAALRSPSEQDLRIGLSVLLGDVRDGGLLEERNKVGGVLHVELLE